MAKRASTYHRRAMKSLTKGLEWLKVGCDIYVDTDGISMALTEIYEADKISPTIKASEGEEYKEKTAFYLREARNHLEAGETLKARLSIASAKVYFTAYKEAKGKERTHHDGYA